MKKSMKKILAVILAVSVVAVCFAACGKEPAADAEKTIKIGGSGPLTGDYAQYGQGVRNGAQLAINEINEAGGVNGYKLSLLDFQDDEGDPEKAVNAYNKLIDYKMQLSLGTVTSGACIAFQGKAAADNMFVLTPSATAVEAINGDNAFRVCFSDPNQGVASADYIAAHSLANKVAVIYDSSNPYSSGIYEKFATQAKVKGIEITTAQSFTGDTKTDFSAQLQSIKNTGAELVFLPIYYSEASIIIQQAKAVGIDVKWFGCDGLDGLLKIANFDLSLAEGVMLLTPFSADAQDQYTLNFVAKYSAAYGVETMNQFAADAYDAIYIMKAAMEKAAITPDMTASETCDAMKAAMTQIQVDGVTGTGITWAADGEPTKAPKAVIIENGAYKAAE